MIGPNVRRLIATKMAKDAIPPGAHFEIKFRGPDNVVFDISDRPWPGSVAVEPGELEADKDVPVTAK